MDEHTQKTLVQNLVKMSGPGQAECIQTHISSIILRGDVAYKLKKPVDFGFLDYSTLEKRRRCCLDEVRINRRFAESLYLGVVPVTGTVDAPVMEGEGEAIEYAVKMRRFEQADQLDNMADRGALDIGIAETMACLIADAHASSASAGAETDYGEPQRVVAPMRENFALLEETAGEHEELAALRARTEKEFERLTPLLARRKCEGFVRECHGDMHLHNMAFFEGELILFDAIEFNPYLSHIDVISDLAFLLMDLEYRGLSSHSRRLLNRYLEITGDYEGVALLDFYKTYRAMVRAKVASLRAAQELSPREREEVRVEVRKYIDLAGGYGGEKNPFLAITHGFSGSGKSSCALMMVERYGAIRIRSDVERMRLFRTEEKPGTNEDVYTAEATRKTYGRLAELARILAQSGFCVVVDATFLKSAQRRIFMELSSESGLPFMILDIRCDPGEMRQRIRKRLSEGSDVSEADLEVLERQMQTAEALSADEADRCIGIDCMTYESMRRSIESIGI